MPTLQPLTEKTLTDQVADRIRAAIHAGEYKPGTRLVERTLAAELSVSHIPVREALARLVDEGLVEHLPRRGARVATLSETELEELSTLRVQLEQFVVVRVQQRLTPTGAAELEGVIERMVKAARRGDVTKVLEIDQLFHERLWELAAHRMLIELVSQLRGRLNSFLRAANLALEPEALEEHAASHRQLLESIASGDPERAKAAMEAHVLVAAERVRSTILAAPAEPA